VNFLEVAKLRGKIGATIVPIRQINCQVTLLRKRATNLHLRITVAN
jgi:hypothetical protein